MYDYMNSIYAFNLFSQELVIYKHAQGRGDASFVYIWKSLCFQFTVCAHPVPISAQENDALELNSFL